MSRLLGFLLLVLGVGLLLAPAVHGIDPKPESVEEAKIHVQHAKADVLAAERLLEEARGHPGLYDKLKAALGGGGESHAEESKESVLEKVKHLFKTGGDKFEGKDAESVGDKLKHALGMETSSEAAVRKAKEAAEEAARTSLFGRARAGLASILTGGRDTAAETAEAAKDRIGQVGETLKEKAVHAGEAIREKAAEAGHRVAESARYAGDVIKEKVSGAAETTSGKLKDAAAAVRDATVHKYEEARDAMGHLLHRAGEKAEDVKGKAANVAEEGKATVMEKVKSAFGFGEKVKEGGRDAAAIAADAARGGTGVGEGEGILGRTRERLASLLSLRESEPTLEQLKSNLRQKLKAVSDATDVRTRGVALDDLKRAFDKAKGEVSSQTAALYELLSGGLSAEGKQPEGVRAKMQSLKNDMALRMHHMYDAMSDWTRDVSDRILNLPSRMFPPKNESFLLQTSRYEDGITFNYVNDNGREYLDVTGDIDPVKFPKLKVLNHFRHEFELPPLSEMPADASVQVHQTRRPHVLLKSSRIIGGNEYEYTYDDGEETLMVMIADKHPAPEFDEEKLINTFRQAFGISLSAPRKITTRTKRIKDEL